MMLGIRGGSQTFENRKVLPDEAQREHFASLLANDPGPPARCSLGMHSQHRQ